MIRICISGFSASGKTTIGNELAKKLNIMHVTKKSMSSFKSFAAENKDAKDDNTRLAETTSTKEYADSFDKEVIRLARENDCVVTTWLGPWFVKDATLRIWLNTRFEERVRRRALDRKISMKLAREEVGKKDKLTTENIKKLYGIDIMDHSIFDIEINTERFTTKEEVDMIALLTLEMAKGRFK
jgi:predicted cytidylate kinase